MSDLKAVHPRRRKHRRGKSAGKKRKAAAAAQSPAPAVISSLRSRLALIAQRS